MEKGPEKETHPERGRSLMKNLARGAKRAARLFPLILATAAVPASQRPVIAQTEIEAVNLAHKEILDQDARRVTVEAALLRNLKPSSVTEDGKAKGQLVLGQTFAQAIEINQESPHPAQKTEALFPQVKEYGQSLFEDQTSRENFALATEGLLKAYFIWGRDKGANTTLSDFVSSLASQENLDHTWAYYQTFQVENQNRGVEIPEEQQHQVYAQIIRWTTQATVNGVEYEVRSDLPKPEQTE